MEDIWEALCDKALQGDQKALLEVLRLSDIPRESSKGEAERAGELADQDYQMLEELPQDLQALCVQNDWSLTAILDRFCKLLPLSADELRLAQALVPGNED